MNDIVSNVKVISSDQNLTRIDILGMFNGMLQHSFCKIFDKVQSDLYVLDFSQCDFIDSVGLGAISLLYLHAKKTNSQIDVINVKNNEEFKQIFDKSMLNQLITIKYRS